MAGQGLLVTEQQQWRMCRARYVTSAPVVVWSFPEIQYAIHFDLCIACCFHYAQLSHGPSRLSGVGRHRLDSDLAPGDFGGVKSTQAYFAGRCCTTMRRSSRHLVTGQARYGWEVPIQAQCNTSLQEFRLCTDDDL